MSNINKNKSKVVRNAWKAHYRGGKINLPDGTWGSGANNNSMTRDSLAGAVPRKSRKRG